MVGVLRELSGGMSGRVRRPVLALMLLMFLGACARVPPPDVLQTATSAPPVGASQVTVYVATSRTRQSAQNIRFTSNWSPDNSYERYRISVPPDHAPGELEWVKGNPDPSKAFAVVGQSALDENTFFADLAKLPASEDAGIYIHGYNTSYQEALLRAAQLDADAGLNTTSILFSWPSKAEISEYLADKDAATSSRMNLTRLLERTVKARAGGDVIVFAHSMGGWLLMESLVQLKLEGRDEVLAHLRVFMASADIDPDVFRSQLQIIGRMKLPMTIFVSPGDFALRLSSLISNDRQRVGALDVRDPLVRAQSAKMGIQVVDISQFKSSDRTGHDRYAAIAAAIAGRGKDGRQLLEDNNKAGSFTFGPRKLVAAGLFKAVD